MKNGKPVWRTKGFHERFIAPYLPTDDTSGTIARGDLPHRWEEPVEWDQSSAIKFVRVVFNDKTDNPNDKPSPARKMWGWVKKLFIK